MQSGRELFDGFLKGQPGTRAPFVPLIDELAARVETIPYRAMCADPSAWTAALIKTAQLIGADTVVTALDTTMVATACGVTADGNGTAAAASAVETLKRVVATAAASMGCAAALAGPVSVARRSFAADDVAVAWKRLKQPYAALVESLLQARPDMLLFVENLADLDGAIPPGAARAYNTLSKLAAYFDIPVAIYLDGYTAAGLEAVTTVKIDIRILGSAQDGTAPDLASAIDLADGVLGAGIGVGLESPALARAQIEAANAACANGCNLLITGLGPVSPDIDLEALRALTGDCHGDSQ